jgi:hypothetical protein
MLALVVGAVLDPLDAAAPKPKVTAAIGTAIVDRRADRRPAAPVAEAPANRIGGGKVQLEAVALAAGAPEDEPLGAVQLADDCQLVA